MSCHQRYGIGSSKLETQKRWAALHSASNRSNPGDADMAHGSQPIDQLSGVMLKVPNVVELQFQFAERKPGKS